MPFVRPTLAELVSRIESDLTSRLQIDSPILRRALVRVIARASAGGMHGIHGHLDWAANQLFATTAEAEFLDLHGAEIGVRRRVATFAAGAVTFTGTNGTLIPPGTRLQRSDGASFTTTATASISAGIATTNVKALSAGAHSNCEEDTALALVSPIAGISSALTVAEAGISGGLDAESDSTYRSAILSRKRNPPQGGALADYKKWVLEVAGVTRVWVQPNYMGPGTVGITFVQDDLEDIIPTPEMVEAVQAHIDDPSRRPLCATVDVYAPTAVPLDVTVHIVPDNANVRAAVIAELQDLLLREAEPGITIPKTHLNEAISAAAGEFDHTLSIPSGNVDFGPAELPVLGVVTFV